jgi:hypothetical protein
MAPSCSDFSSFNPTKFSVPQVDNPNQASFNQTVNRGVVSDLQLETARLALACGRTRVVSIVYEHERTNPIKVSARLGCTIRRTSMRRPIRPAMRLKRKRMRKDGGLASVQPRLVRRATGPVHSDVEGHA